MRKGISFYEMIWLLWLYFSITHELHGWTFWINASLIFCTCPKWKDLRDWYDDKMYEKREGKKEEYKQIEIEVNAEAEEKSKKRD